MDQKMAWEAFKICQTKKRRRTEWQKKDDKKKAGRKDEKLRECSGVENKEKMEKDIMAKIEKERKNTRQNKKIRERGERQSGILTPDLQLTDTVAVATQRGCCVCCYKCWVRTKLKYAITFLQLSKTTQTLDKSRCYLDKLLQTWLITGLKS